MSDICFLKKPLIAHRGIHYRYRENSLKAFRLAVIEKYTIELDVHLTIDNKVIVYHDNNLKRLTGINKEIRKCSYQEIINIIEVPTLEEVLDLVKGRVAIIIELKFDTKFRKIEKEVAKILDNYSGKFAIQSFNPFSIIWFHFNRKNYVRGYLINSIFSKNPIMKYLLNRKILNILMKPDYMGINLKYLKKKKIQKMREKYLIIGYTINDNRQYNDYYVYADNFICNIGKEPFIRL